MLPKFLLIFILLFYLIILPRQIQAQVNLTDADLTNQASKLSVESPAELPQPPPAAEALKTILIIDEITAKKGYSAQSPDKNFILGLYPNILTSNLKVEIEEKNNSGNLPASANLIGKIYAFKLSLNNQPVILSKFFPLTINLAVNKQDESSEEAENKNYNGRKAVLYSFLTPQNKWIALKSKITSDKATALIDFSQATIAVFSSQDQSKLPAEIQIAAADNSQQNLTDINNGEREKNNPESKITAGSEDNDNQEQKFTIYLRDDIIEKGYTAAYPNPIGQSTGLIDAVVESEQSAFASLPADSEANVRDSQIIEPPVVEFKIAILPKILAKSVNLQIKKYPQNNFSALPVDDENYRIMTDVYEYDFQSALVKLEKDKKLILEINSLPTNQYNKKSIFFLDETINKWRLLPSKYNLKQNSVRAFVYFPYVKIAVFKNNNVKTGQASWFADRLSSTVLGAASNDFPRDAILKIKNLENNKSVKAKVVSSGPFVKDRIIDLTYSAFAAIANPKQGVVEVEVEKLID